MPQPETRKLQIGKFTSKSKPTENVGNHPHTNMISKPATVRRLQMHNTGNTFEIKRPQLKTILYMYILLYQNLMVGIHWWSSG